MLGQRIRSSYAAQSYATVSQPQNVTHKAREFFFFGQGVTLGNFVSSRFEIIWVTSSGHSSSTWVSSHTVILHDWHFLCSCGVCMLQCPSSISQPVGNNPCFVQGGIYHSQYIVQLNCGLQQSRYTKHGLQFQKQQLLFQVIQLYIYMVMHNTLPTLCIQRPWPEGSTCGRRIISNDHISASVGR